MKGIAPVEFEINKTQNLNSFEITVPGKWILAGEHSVLRGYEALVFPLFSRYLKIKYRKTEQEFELYLNGENTSDLELIIWSVLEKALKILGLKRSRLTGVLTMDSKIALGGGMGASATLCVALTEWLTYLGHIKLENQFNFARDLENLFHGESSGVDVAVTLMKKPLVFSRIAGFSELNVNSKVKLYLSYSGQRGVTKDCVEKVKRLTALNSEIGQKIDLQMSETVQELKLLLKMQSSSLSDWSNSLRKANSCFEQWGLVSETVQKHQADLLKHGALAVKLTGSGGGGYVLSLWDQNPPDEIPFEMIDCFK